MELNNCCSPLENGLRCANAALSNSFHCADHSNLAKTLYKKYKKCQSEVDVLLNKKKTTIYQYLSLYSKLYQECKLRHEHQIKYFHPSCYDIGHQIYVKNRSKLIDECEKEIEKLINEQIQDKIENEKDENNGQKINKMKEEKTENKKDEKLSISQNYQQVKSDFDLENKLFNEMIQEKQKWLNNRNKKISDLRKKFYTFLPNFEEKWIYWCFYTPDEKQKIDLIHVNVDAISLIMFISYSIFNSMSIKNKKTSFIMLLNKFKKFYEIIDEFDDEDLDNISYLIDKESVQQIIIDTCEILIKGEYMFPMLISDNGDIYFCTINAIEGEKIAQHVFNCNKFRKNRQKRETI